MKGPKCTLCGGKGWYIGVAPPGKDVRCACLCGIKKRGKDASKTDK